jgi:hypothetical protein
MQFPAREPSSCAAARPFVLGTAEALLPIAYLDRQRPDTYSEHAYTYRTLQGVYGGVYLNVR